MIHVLYVIVTLAAAVYFFKLAVNLLTDKDFTNEFEKDFITEKPKEKKEW